MPLTTGTLTPPETRVLRTLACGGLLDRSQIERSARLDHRDTGKVIRNLSTRHLIVIRSYDKRWSITDLGRNTLATKPLLCGALHA